MNQSIEEWVPIRGAFGYEISNKGNIKKNNRLLKIYIKNTYITNPNYRRLFCVDKYIKIKYDGSLTHMWGNIKQISDMNKPDSTITGIIWL